MSKRTQDLTPAAIAERARAYVRENFLYMRPDWPLSDDDPLLESGVIDSIGVVELIEFLQDEFHCTFEEDEITERNMGSIGAIARFVHAKCTGGGVRAA
ncbi:MAG TPA: acyl carrier protein [Gemmatimonadales bacterium]|nr:acyl carrier protein [Gemmatimonadales bacterium]